MKGIRYNKKDVQNYFKLIARLSEYTKDPEDAARLLDIISPVLHASRRQGIPSPSLPSTLQVVSSTLHKTHFIQYIPVSFPPIHVFININLSLQKMFYWRFLQSLQTSCPT